MLRILGYLGTLASLAGMALLLIKRPAAPAGSDSSGALASRRWLAFLGLALSLALSFAIPWHVYDRYRHDIAGPAPLPDRLLWVRQAGANWHYLFVGAMGAWLASLGLGMASAVSHAFPRRMAGARRAFARSFVAQFLLAAALAWGCHVTLAYLMRNARLDMSTIEPDAAPLFARVEPRLTVFMAFPIALFVILLSGATGFFRRKTLPFAGAALAGAVAFAAMACAVSMSDGGPEALIAPFERSEWEYFGDVPKVDSPRAFLRDYVARWDNLSLHSKTHPPGGVLFLWLVSKIAGPGIWTAAFATILFASLSVPLIASMARALWDDSTWRHALALSALTPAPLLYAATCMDAVFAVFLLAALWLYLKSSRGDSAGLAILTGLAIGLSFFMTFAAVVPGAFFLAASVRRAWGRVSTWGAETARILLIGAGFLLFFLLLYAATGYNQAACLAAALHTAQEYVGTGREHAVQYVAWSVANLAAFLIGMGLASVTLFARSVVRGEIPEDNAVIPGFARTGAVLLALFSFSTLFSMETERVWLFLAPIVVLPAARELREMTGDGRRSAPLALVAALLFAQALGAEIVLYTYW